jgi:hypothetical protein
MAKSQNFYDLYDKYIVDLLNNSDNIGMIELGLFHGSSVEYFATHYEKITYIGVDVFEASRNDYLYEEFSDNLKKFRRSEINKFNDKMISDMNNENTQSNRSDGLSPFLFDISLLQQQIARQFKHDGKSIQDVSNDLYSMMVNKFNMYPNVHLLKASISFYNNDDLKRRFIEILEEPYEEFNGIEYVIDNVTMITNTVNIIIDDASHRKEDQQFALGKLFKLLNKGGYYIIEDLHCLRLNRFNRVQTQHDTYNFLKIFMETSELITNQMDDDDKAYFKDNVENIEFFYPTPISGKKSWWYSSDILNNVRESIAIIKKK